MTARVSLTFGTYDLIQDCEENGTSKPTTENVSTNHSVRDTESNRVIHRTHGYSRDHRPDLNQVILQLIVENQAGIPLLMKTMDGNSDDKTGFRETIQAHIA